MIISHLRKELERQAAHHETMLADVEKLIAEQIVEQVGFSLHSVVSCSRFVCVLAAVLSCVAQHQESIVKSQEEYITKLSNEVTKYRSELARERLKLARTVRKLERYRQQLGLSADSDDD
jgi:uncharacterized coiled-coil protein SlyX